MLVGARQRAEVVERREGQQRESGRVGRRGVEAVGGGVQHQRVADQAVGQDRVENVILQAVDLVDPHLADGLRNGDARSGAEREEYERETNRVNHGVPRARATGRVTSAASVCSVTRLAITTASPPIWRASRYELGAVGRRGEQHRDGRRDAFHPYPP